MCSLNKTKFTFTNTMSHNSLKGHIKIDGCTLYKKYLTLKDQVDNYDVNENDIWICTFPKSGTTWVCEMVWLIMNDLDYEGAKKFIYDRTPFFELTGISEWIDTLTQEKLNEISLPQYFEDSLKWCKTVPSPAVIKTHLPLNLLPKKLQTGLGKNKFIYVSRNPGDCCTSYFNHYKLVSNYKGSLDEFCKRFLDGEVFYAPYWDHVLPYWTLRNSPNFLFLKFEDMKQDLPGTIRKMAHFLQRSVSEDQIKILADHLSFETMKKNRAVNFDNVVEFRLQHKLIDRGGSFWDSGAVGGHKEKMSRQFVELFEKWTNEHTKETNYYL